MSEPLIRWQDIENARHDLGEKYLLKPGDIVISATVRENTTYLPMIEIKEDDE